MDLKKIAKSLPYPLQKSIKYVYSIVPVKFRYGKAFWETYNFLQESQWWSKEKLEEYQMKQLGKLLDHAYKNVPYYRKLFNEHSIKPHDIIKCLEDFKKIPFLTKDIVKKNIEILIDKSADPKKLLIAKTSGTTGKSLQWYIEDTENQKQLAYIYNQWARVGLKPGEPIVRLKGSVIYNRELAEYDIKHRVLRLSPIISTKKVAEYYIEKINRFGAKFLQGYPSAISIFAFMIKKYKLRVPFELKAILFASEAIYHWEKEITEEVFNCRIFSHYGLAERVVLAGECERSNKYHCIPQYGITEIGNENNEIIGTSFINYITPFIRYKTTDIAAGEIKPNCNKCGRNYFPIFSSVEGRIEDFIITPQGDYLPPAVITHLLKDFKAIKNVQIVQKSLNLIEVNVVPWENCSQILFDNEIQNLHISLQKIIGSNVEIRINIVDEIKLSKSGKFRWIVSEVSKDMLKNGLLEN